MNNATLKRLSHEQLLLCTKRLFDDYQEVMQLLEEQETSKTCQMDQVSTLDEV